MFANTNLDAGRCLKTIAHTTARQADRSTSATVVQLEIQKDLLKYRTILYRRS